MSFKTVTAKIGNMRKPQDFVVYPQGEDKGVLVVQADTVIAKIDAHNGNAVFANVAGGAYFHHLITSGKKIVVPMDVVQLFIDATPQKGDRINSFVTIG